MNTLGDQELLRDYVEKRSEAAFAEVVSRHVNFVYSAALRMVRDVHLAQDVTQNVFVALAQDAPELMRRPVLAGWLHQTARNLAAKAIRSEVRRREREQEAAIMNDLLSTEPKMLWSQIAPQLDAALGDLSDADREALLLRYFEQKSAREMAQTLGTSEDAAQKRLSRAVDRLRDVFAQRGIAVGPSGLALLITANAVQAAPPGLALTISSVAACAGTTVVAGATATTTKAIVMTTLQKAIVTATVTVAVGTAIYEGRQTAALRNQVRELQQQRAPLAGEIEQLARERDDAMRRMSALLAKPSPQLPAPRMQVAPEPVENLQPTNLYTRIMKPDTEKLTLQQVEPYLAANRRNAASLLAAYRTTGDQALLVEAMEKFPDNPQVAFEAVYRKLAPPEEQQRWLEVLKKSDPDNALGYYLSALEYFKSGQSDQAVQNLIAASGRQQFQDYSMARGQDDEEAYLAAGHSPAEAKALASSQLRLPHLAFLKQLSGAMIDLAKSYQQNGDAASAQATLDMAVNLGQRFNGSPGEPLISRLVGIAVERNALGAMDQSGPYGSGQTVQDRANELARQRTAIAELASQFETVGEQMTDADWIHYIDRWRSFGELAATQWVLGKYGQR